MAWIITNPNWFTKFDNGDFEGSIVSGDYLGSNDGFTTSGFSTEEFFTGTKSFFVRFIDNNFFQSELPFVVKGLGRFRSGSDKVAGRRYTVNGRFFLTGTAQLPGKPIRLMMGFSGDGTSNEVEVGQFFNTGTWKTINAQIIANYSAVANNTGIYFRWKWLQSDYATSPVKNSRIYFDAFSVTEEQDVPPPIITVNYSKVDVSIFGGNDGAIDITSVTGGIGPYSYLWNDGFVTQDRVDLVAGTYILTVTDTGSDAIKVLSIQINQPELLVVTYTKQDATTVGGSDGSITVNITGGSGSRSYSWLDGPTTQNRSGLSAGSYQLTITDLITGEVVVLNIEILDPAPVVNVGTFLEVPAMQSLHFVIEQAVDSCDNPQTLDNVLFCQQKHPYFAKGVYYQKVQKCDALVTQFNSDFEAFEISLNDYLTGTIIKSFGFEMKEQNIGLSEDYNISIRNHTTPGQSRIYFQVGPLPIPLKIGDNFEILNNLDGYNGFYQIVDIINDTLLGYQYLVINKNFTGPGLTSLATGRFQVSTANFNVFESGHDFLDVPDGLYFMKIKGFDDVGGSMTAISEPIDLKVEHPDTNPIDFRNFDNAFGMTWTTGYIGRIRVESVLFNRLTGGERTMSRNSNFSLVKVSARKQRIILFETFMLPPYLHEKLSVIFDLDFFKVSGIEFQASEGYAEPKYITRFKLANSSIKLEQVNWLDTYNSNDIGTVNEGGFIIGNEGFLKR